MTPIDARAARRRFERAAPGYGAAAALEAEVGRRMLERLDYVRVAPARVLDAGCGTGRDAAALAKRYRGALVLALDHSGAMLREAQRGLLATLLGRAPARVCADLTRLPLAAGSVDLVWSNLALPWIGEPLEAFREFGRVLAPEGLLMFSACGPDTLKELRAAAGEARVHGFIDMHDLGDRLVEAGFAAPVMDMEIITLTYASPEAFLAEQRAAGRSSARADRPRGLAGRRWRERLIGALGAQMRDARLPASCEVVYGHAWKGAPRETADGRAIVRFERAISRPRH